VLRVLLIPDEETYPKTETIFGSYAGTQAFLYTISANSVGSGAERLAPKETGCGWHKIQITPSNKMLMTGRATAAAVGRGQEVYNSDGVLDWHMFDNSLHTDVGRDFSGNEIAIGAGSQTPTKMRAAAEASRRNNSWIDPCNFLLS